jgi:hypothetical protein
VSSRLCRRWAPRCRRFPPRKRRRCGRDGAHSRSGRNDLPGIANAPPSARSNARFWAAIRWPISRHRPGQADDAGSA